MTMIHDTGRYKLLTGLTETQTKDHGAMVDRLVAIAESLELPFDEMKARLLEERAKLLAEG